MVVGSGEQETLDPGFVLLGTRQQGVSVILKKLVLFDGFDPVSPSFTVYPWSPAFGWLEIGDEILEIEGHLGTELTEQESYSLTELKSNYLRLGIRRFSEKSNVT
ncbi:unnamed protein product [Schistosoma margrebowiei]|uniref:Uncharacterized protein n=1 Tax=Schistosoma margrebowiei TaxID=48269 RepID=A0A183LT06_9TREM|nr:unnamed protein product [Schistosoma margrebowiei]